MPEARKIKTALCLHVCCFLHDMCEYVHMCACKSVHVCVQQSAGLTRGL